MKRESIDVLAEDPQNPRAIEEPALAGLRMSMERFGDVAGITWNERTGQLVSGHVRVRGLRAAGATEWTRNGATGYIDHPKTGERFLVRIVDWDENQQRAANLTANNPAVQGHFTEAAIEQLEVLKTAIPEFPDLMLDQMLDTLAAELGTDEQDAPKERAEAEVPVAAEPTTKPGDLWILGRHRLICGDSFDEDSMARLMDGQDLDLFLGDPPYAIYGSSTGIGADIADDKMVRPFFEAMLRLAQRLLKPFGHAYVCCDWRSWPSIWEASRRTEMTPKNLLIWDKGQGGLGSNYANCYECIGYLAKLPKQTAMKSTAHRGQRQVHAPNILRYPRTTGDERLHNAAKPVGMFEELIRNSTEEREVVLDPFCGSGTTIMACERSGRRGFSSELEPKNCDIAVARWERLTGQKAVRVDPRDEQAVGSTT